MIQTHSTPKRKRPFKLFELKIWALILLTLGCGIEVGNPDDDPTDENLAVVGLEVSPDSSSDIESLSLAFSSVEFVRDDGSTTTLATTNPDQYVDLAADTENGLSLTEQQSEATTTQVVNEARLPAGEYTSVILYVNKAKRGRARFRGSELPLDIGEDSYEAIEVSIGISITNEGTNEIVLSPSLSDSLQQSGDGDRFIFRPSFRSSKRKKAGFVYGNISGQSMGLLCAYPLVKVETTQSTAPASENVINNKNVFRSKRPEITTRPEDLSKLRVCAGTPFRSRLRLNGRFRFHHRLPGGDYKLILRTASGEIFESTTDVPIVAGTANQLSDITMQAIEGQ